MGNKNSTRFVVGVIGNVISGGLFLSPIPTFRQIWKNKDVEAFDSKPYLATVFNCLCWCYYGTPFVNPNNILVVTINGAGLLIELMYLAIFSYYTTAKGRKWVSGVLVGEGVAFATLFATTMLLIPGHKMLLNRPLRAFIVGCVCDIFNVIMYASPMFIIGKVIETKSVKYMPFTLSLVSFLNGCCWTAYALIGKVDYFILLSNGLGAIAGLVQLMVYAIYWKRGKPEEQSVLDNKPTNELQLSTMA